MAKTNIAVIRGLTKFHIKILDVVEKNIHNWKQFNQNQSRVNLYKTPVQTIYKFLVSCSCKTVFFSVESFCYFFLVQTERMIFQKIQLIDGFMGSGEFTHVLLAFLINLLIFHFYLQI